VGGRRPHGRRRRADRSPLFGGGSARGSANQSALVGSGRPRRCRSRCGVSRRIDMQVRAGPLRGDGLQRAAWRRTPTMERRPRCVWEKRSCWACPRRAGRAVVPGQAGCISRCGRNRAGGGGQERRRSSSSSAAQSASASANCLLVAAASILACMRSCCSLMYSARLPGELRIIRLLGKRHHRPSTSRRLGLGPPSLSGARPVGSQRSGSASCRPSPCRSTRSLNAIPARTRSPRAALGSNHTSFLQRQS